MKNDRCWSGVGASTPRRHEAPAATKWVARLLLGACVVAGSCGPPEASLRLEMRFSFFEDLSSEEAEAFLRNFLAEEAKAVPELLRAGEGDGIHGDYSLASIEPLFSWAVTSARTIPRAPDPELPAWIRATPGISRDSFDLDAQSSLTVLRLAYYWGESFVRTFPSLRWSFGAADTAEQNMPVVTGFEKEMQLATLLVAENLFLRSITDGAQNAGIGRAVEFWKSLVAA